MSIEARAARAGAPAARLYRTGIGARRATRAAGQLTDTLNRTILIAGFCGALDPELKPGDIVLATELRSPTKTTVCEDPQTLADALCKAGLRARIAPILSSNRIELGDRRTALHRTGAVAVDMESAPIAEKLGTDSLVTMRVVLDTPRQELYRPLRSLRNLITAYRTLKRACAAANDWAQTIEAAEAVASIETRESRAEPCPSR
jgi:4-hydroxy-3-methylbut-2-enyl diphosphate reductase